MIKCDITPCFSQKVQDKDGPEKDSIAGDSESEFEASVF